MFKSRYGLLLVLAIGALVIAGCGDDGKNKDDDTGSADGGQPAPATSPVTAPEEDGGTGLTPTDIPALVLPPEWTDTPAVSHTPDPNQPTDMPSSTPEPSQTSPPGPTFTLPPGASPLPPSWTPPPSATPQPTRPSSTPRPSKTPRPSATTYFSPTPSNTPPTPSPTAAGPVLQITAERLNGLLFDLMSDGSGWLFEAPPQISFRGGLMIASMNVLVTPGDATTARPVEIQIVPTTEEGRVRLTVVKAVYTDEQGAIFQHEIIGLTLDTIQNQIDLIITEGGQRFFVAEVVIVDDKALELKTGLLPEPPATPMPITLT